MTKEVDSAGSTSEQVPFRRGQLIDLRLAAVQVQNLSLAARRVRKAAGKGLVDHSLCLDEIGAVIEAILTETENLLNLLGDLDPAVQK